MNTHSELANTATVKHVEDGRLWSAIIKQVLNLMHSSPLHLCAHRSATGSRTSSAPHSGRRNIEEVGRCHGSCGGCSRENDLGRWCRKCRRTQHDAGWGLRESARRWTSTEGQGWSSSVRMRCELLVRRMFLRSCCRWTFSLYRRRVLQKDDWRGSSLIHRKLTSNWLHYLLNVPVKAHLIVELLN